MLSRKIRVKKRSIKNVLSNIKNKPTKLAIKGFTLKRKLSKKRVFKGYTPLNAKYMPKLKLHAFFLAKQTDYNNRLRHMRYGFKLKGRVFRKRIPIISKFTGKALRIYGRIQYKQTKTNRFYSKTRKGYFYGFKYNLLRKIKRRLRYNNKSKFVIKQYKRIINGTYRRRLKIHKLFKTTTIPKFLTKKSKILYFKRNKIKRIVKLTTKLRFRYFTGKIKKRVKIKRNIKLQNNIRFLIKFFLRGRTLQLSKPLRDSVKKKPINIYHLFKRRQKRIKVKPYKTTLSKILVRIKRRIRNSVKIKKKQKRNINHKSYFFRFILKGRSRIARRTLGFFLSIPVTYIDEEKTFSSLQDRLKLEYQYLKTDNYNRRRPKIEKVKDVIYT